jgi:hypothetical protein
MIPGSVKQEYLQVIAKRRQKFSMWLFCGLFYKKHDM